MKGSASGVSARTHGQAQRHHHGMADAAGAAAAAPRKGASSRKTRPAAHNPDKTIARLFIARLDI
ncbi:MAG: hypothetical protein ACTHJ1_18985, partial [Bordetella sp.]|uniref:hypothetical protein n=1 Tax=Bordetella sp. TaxID=28081 RepID=UPI003F7B50B1